MSQNMKEIQQAAQLLQRETKKAYEQGVTDTLNNKLEHSMSAAILEQYKGAAFQEGAKYALEYLSDLYDGIEETDIWADYMKEENN